MILVKTKAQWKSIVQITSLKNPRNKKNVEGDNQKTFVIFVVKMNLEGCIKIRGRSVMLCVMLIVCLRLRGGVLGVLGIIRGTRMITINRMTMVIRINRIIRINRTNNLTDMYINIYI